MKINLVLVVTAVVMASACHRDGAGLNRKDQQYDVVQEGSASGVTSTINGPGEAPPPVSTAPITGTSAAADTTTAFTLPTPAPGASGQQQPGTLAGTLPPVGSVPPMTSASGERVQRPVARPQTPPRTTTIDTTSPQQEPRTRPAPPTTDTTATESAPPATTTTNPTTTSTDTSGQSNRSESPRRSDQPPTSTQPKPENPPPDSPPPPPPTDTRGQGC